MTTTTRPRISDKALGEYEDAIALINRIEREMAAIETDLDIDTRRYHHRRIGRIFDAAAQAKRIVIQKMVDEKDGACERR